VSWVVAAALTLMSLPFLIARGVGGQPPNPGPKLAALAPLGIVPAVAAVAVAALSSWWLALVLAYAAANVTASVAAARKSGWATLPYLPAVFTVYHFSWGLGFLAGLRWFLPGAAQPQNYKSFFTRTSR